MEQIIEFFRTPYGIAIFSIAAAVVVLLFLAVNYKLFAKVLLDYIAATISLIILSPVILISASIMKKRTGSAYQKVWIAGKGCKPVQVSIFADYTLADGKLCYISRSSIKYFPLLASVLSGKLSIVGPAPLPLKDTSLTDDEFEPRFSIRPGILTAACLNFEKRPEYEAMFEADCNYISKRGLLKDALVLIIYAVRGMRGESGGFLSLEKAYAEELLNNGKITEEQYEQAKSYAAEEVEAARRAPMRVGE